MKRWIVCSLLFLVASGCALKLDDGVDSAQVYSLDAVKLISPGITLGDDESSFGQGSYQLGADRRLLMRFESLRSHVSSIRVDGGRKVELRIKATEGSAQSLSVCPITKNWMMLATWRRAHPMGRAGDWARDGGDLDEETCVSPREEGGHAYFDMTAWFVDYVRGRGINYGLAMKSAADVRVLGETSGSSSPRLLWVE